MIASFKSRRSLKPVAAPSEDLLKQLVNYDVIILMDDSSSMWGSRWKQARKVMKGVVEKAVLYDENGIEIRFLNNQKWGTVKTKEDVKQLFKEVKPQELTPLGKRLGDLCNDYLRKLENPKVEPKRCLIIAITDGAPTDKAQVYATIKNTAKKLDSLGAPLTQFVQIGDDRGAAAFLRELDDSLKGNKDGQVGRDIVDTVPYDGVDLTSDEMTKILAGAINRRVDNQNRIGR